ncbi:MAG: hypothetical protein Kow00128_11320 [Deltaproteobacteria bacterium]
MKTLYNRRGVRRGDGDRSQFAFFLTGAIVVLAVVFVIGIQVGRLIEKHAAEQEVASGKAGGEILVGKETAGETGPPPGAAGGGEGPPPQNPAERIRDTERSVTFRETLEKAGPVSPKLTPSVPAGSAASKPRDAASSASRLYVQAAAFRNRQGADAMREKLEKAGFSATVSPSMSRKAGMIHRVLVGPYDGKQEAERALRTIAESFRTRPFLVRH